MQRPKAHPRSREFSVSRLLQGRWRGSWRALRDHQFRALRGHGQPHQKSAADAVRVVARGYFSAMRADDAVADAQAKSGALPDFLGGKERIKNALGMGDAGTIVAKCDFDLAIVMDSADLDFAGAADFLNRVVGVVQNV